MERWWCLDCRAPVELNRHARCPYCDSEAVDTMERTRTDQKCTPSIFTPVADVYAERVTVHLGAILHWRFTDESQNCDKTAYTH